MITTNQKMKIPLKRSELQKLFFLKTRLNNPNPNLKKIGDLYKAAIEMNMEILLWQRLWSKMLLYRNLLLKRTSLTSHLTKSPSQNLSTSRLRKKSRKVSYFDHLIRDSACEIALKKRKKEALRWRIWACSGNPRRKSRGSTSYHCCKNSWNNRTKSSANHRRKKTRRESQEEGKEKGKESRRIKNY